MEEKELNERIMKWNERSADSQLNELEECVGRGKPAEDLILFIRSLLEALKNNGIDISEKEKRLAGLEERMERKIGTKETLANPINRMEEALTLKLRIKWLEQYVKGEPSPYKDGETAISNARDAIQAFKNKGGDTSEQEKKLAELERRMGEKK